MVVVEAGRSPSVSTASRTAVVRLAGSPAVNKSDGSRSATSRPTSSSQIASQAAVSCMDGLMRSIS